MSEIIERCREYAQGRITFAQLKAWMDGFTFADPWRNHPNMPTDPSARMSYIDDNALDEDGTLWELMGAVRQNYLTIDQYWELLMGRAERAADGKRGEA